MRERIFNVFLYIRESDDIISELGVVVHERAGPDADKLAYLQEKVRGDFRIARRFKLPRECVYVAPDGTKTERCFSYAGFAALQQANQHMQVFEQMFSAIDAGRTPLMCITPILDGVPRIDGFIELKP